MSIKSFILEKLNPSQAYIFDQVQEEQFSDTETFKLNVRQAVNSVESIARASTLLIDSFAMVNYDVKAKHRFRGRVDGGVKKVSLDSLLNFRPNLEEDINSFRCKLIADYLFEGNFFIYFDGANLYHLPADEMVVHAGKKFAVSHYSYGYGANAIDYTTSEIIHVRDSSVDSFYRGKSRLIAPLTNLNNRRQMIEYQSNFFKNGMAPGIVLTTDSVMSTKMKDRLIKYWTQKFNVRTGANQPLILDAGMKPENISVSDFSKLQYTETIKEIETKAVQAIGVPPLLLDSGNNANIRPNVELFYNMTILPIARKFVDALEAFFGWDIQETTYGIAALTPDLKIEAERVTSLVNNGILTGDEGRAKLREEPLGTPEMTEIRIPANIAGSATGVAGQEGGAPTNEES